MSNKIKNVVLCSVMAVFLFGLTFWAWFKPADKYSDSERRNLAQMPAFNVSTVFNTAGESFMKNFESYTLDQFPARDSFRTVKSFFAYDIYNHVINNGLYVNDGYVAKMEYPLNESSVTKAADVIVNAYNKVIGDKASKVYLTVVPDKGYYMSKESGTLTMDYDKLVSMLTQSADFAEYIDIFPLLSKEDYYKTDTHWRQECIIDVADKLAASMGTTIPTEYTENTLDKDFYGVYHGQSALSLPADKINYLTNDVLDSLKVMGPDKMGFSLTELPLYNFEKAQGKDSYDMFLSGARMSVITVENPKAETDKELIVFRDSFGSSIIPLLSQGYAKVTAIDLRELSVNMGQVERFVDMENSPDVLFMFSSLVLNDSSELKK